MKDSHSLAVIALHGVQYRGQAPHACPQLSRRSLHPPKCASEPRDTPRMDPHGDMLSLPPLTSHRRGLYPAVLPCCESRLRLWRPLWRGSGVIAWTRWCVAPDFAWPRVAK